MLAGRGAGGAAGLSAMPAGRDRALVRMHLLAGTRRATRTARRMKPTTGSRKTPGRGPPPSSRGPDGTFARRGRPRARSPVAHGRAIAGGVDSVHSSAGLAPELFAWDAHRPVYVGGAKPRGHRRERLAGPWCARHYSVMVVTGSMALGSRSRCSVISRALLRLVRGAIFAYVVSWVAVALPGCCCSIRIAVSRRRRCEAPLPRVGFLTDPRAALMTLAGVTI